MTRSTWAVERNGAPVLLERRRERGESAKRRDSEVTAEVGVGRT